MSNETNRLLAELVAANAARGPLPNNKQVQGMSSLILSQVPPQKPWDSGAKSAKDSRGPSFVNRVMDILSRPLYGVMNAATGAVERMKKESPAEGAFEAARVLSPITNPAMLKDIWQGVSGKEKTTGRDFLKATEIDQHLPGPANAALAFGLDVGADPLTYVGGIGLAGKLGKSAKTSTEALHALEQGTQKSAQSLSEEISRKAARQATEQAEIVPKAGEPAPLPGTPPRLFQAGPGPVGLAEQAAREGRIAEGIPEAPRGVTRLDNPNSESALLQQDLEKAELAISGIKDPAEKARQLDSLNAGKRQLEELLKAEKSGIPVKKPMLALEAATPEVKAQKNALEELLSLNQHRAETKNPVIKGQLKKDIAEASAGTDIKDVIKEARNPVVPFGKTTIGTKWVDEAKKAAQTFLKNNRTGEINHIGQSRLYDRILNAASKVRSDRRAFHVLQMLRVAEDEILGAGRKLVDSEGISVRLSDVANMMGGPRALNTKLVDDFRRAIPNYHIEDLKTNVTTPQLVEEVIDPVVKTGADLASVAKDLPPSQTVQLGSQLSKELSKIAENAGASAREAGTAKRFIDELFNPHRDQLYSDVQKQARNLVRQSASGEVNASALHRVSEDVYKALGENPKILGRRAEQGKVTEAIMTKFATWWGAKDLKPFSREYIDTARNVAAAFSETMKPLVEKTTASQRKIAWAVAQGRQMAGSPAEQALADQFRYITERLMGTHGITNNAEAVLLRSGTVLKDLNDELPKALQLVGTKGTDKLGRKFDYTNGNWMHSWREWEVNEPAEALYQLTRSLQMVTRKNAMWDDAAARWGMPVKGGEYQHKVQGIPRLAGTYFPKQIASQLDNLTRQLDRDVFKTPHKSIELFDKVQRIWKTGVTIYSPSHHIRNLNGDIYLAALDGVVSPKPYSVAAKVLHAFPTRYKDMEQAFNIMDPALRDRALRSRPGNVVLTTRKGEKLTAEQLYQAAESQGLFARAMHAEDLVGDGAPSSGTFGPGFKPLGGKLYGAATRASELRDHWVRLAHFTDVLSKSNQPLRVAIEQAGRRVRKFHPDGMDLTGFEQNVLRRVIPFYSWMRKATPLVIEGMLMRPHISMAFPKAMADMQLATGIESEGPGDPFPVDQMFPEWLKEKGIGPILQPGSGLGRDETWRGEAPGYTIINPTNPLLDQLGQIGSPGKTLLSSLTPGIKLPIELLTGQNSLGIPLENQEGGVPGYLAQQIPAVGIGARLTGATRDNEPYNPEQLINWLTSAGVTGTGPYKGQAKMEMQDLMAQIAKKNRGDYR